MPQRRFTQVDVFTHTPLHGNPVAVVHDSAGLTTDDMQRFARWTNLSETTFLAPPTHPDADYSLRIFTPTEELPFAGHPTLGSCHAWLAAGGSPQAEVVQQECAAGLIRIRRQGDTLTFAAPERRRSGPLEPDALDLVTRGLGLEPSDILDHQWCDNGPPWRAVLVGTAEQVLAIHPDHALLDGLEVGVIGPHPAGHDAQFEVRAFFPGASGLIEDPVTGSLNAALGQWLTGTGQAPQRYVAAQGTVLGRTGRAAVERTGDDVWVGGGCVSVVEGLASF